MLLTLPTRLVKKKGYPLRIIGIVYINGVWSWYREGIDDAKNMALKPKFEHWRHADSFFRRKEQHEDVGTIDSTCVQPSDRGPGGRAVEAVARGPESDQAEDGEWS